MPAQCFSVGVFRGPLRFAGWPDASPPSRFPGRSSLSSRGRAVAYFPRTWGAVLLVEAIVVAAVALLAERVEPDRRALARRREPRSGSRPGRPSPLLVGRARCGAARGRADARLRRRGRRRVPHGAARRADELLLGVLGGAAVVDDRRPASSTSSRRRAERPSRAARRVRERVRDPRDDDDPPRPRAGRDGASLARGARRRRRRPRDRCALPLALARVTRRGSARARRPARRLAVDGRRPHRARRDPVRGGARPRAVRIVRRLPTSRAARQRASRARASLALGGRRASSCGRPRSGASRAAERRRGRRSARRRRDRGRRRARGPRGARRRLRLQQGAPDRLLSTSTSFARRLLGGRARDGRPGAAPRRGRGELRALWIRERPALLYAKDAHNGYLETLAELGPVGLAPARGRLLGTRCSPPGGRSADPTGRAALAAYVALLLHVVPRLGPRDPRGDALHRAPRRRPRSTRRRRARSAELRGVARAAILACRRRPRGASRPSRTPATAPRRTRTRRSTAATRCRAPRPPSARGGSCRGRPSRGAFSERPSWPPVVSRWRATGSVARAREDPRLVGDLARPRLRDAGRRARPRAPAAYRVRSTRSRPSSTPSTNPRRVISALEGRG